jgi:ankyrin repeat protein
MSINSAQLPEQSIMFDDNLNILLVNNCISGNLQNVTNLLHDGANSNYILNTKKDTPLSISAHLGYADIVNVLLDKGANIDDKVMLEVLTGDNMNMKANYDRTLELLINRHANVGRLNNGFTCLMMASRNIYLGLILTNALLSYADIEHLDINAISPSGSTALIIAIINHQINVIDALVKYGADVNIKNTKGEPTLMIAVHMQNIATLTILLNSEDIDINIQDSNGNTSVLYMVFRVEQLLKKFPEISTENILHELRIIDMLIKKGANMNIKNNAGISAQSIIDNNNVFSTHLQSMRDYNSNLTRKGGKSLSLLKKHKRRKNKTIHNKKRSLSRRKIYKRK